MYYNNISVLPHKLSSVVEGLQYRRITGYKNNTLCMYLSENNENILSCIDNSHRGLKYLTILFLYILYPYTYPHVVQIQYLHIRKYSETIFIYTNKYMHIFCPTHMKGFHFIYHSLCPC